VARIAGAEAERPMSATPFSNEEGISGSASDHSQTAGTVLSTSHPGRRDDAENFLRRVLPWPAPGQAGWCNVHYTVPGKNVGFPGRAYNKLPQFMGMVRWGIAHPDRIKDIYFCLSLQSQVGEEKGNTFGARRKKENAVAIKGSI
jgi:hypothetical protein